MGTEERMPNRYITIWQEGSEQQPSSEVDVHYVNPVGTTKLDVWL